MLFAKDVLSRVPGGEVIYDVKCTRNLAPWIRTHGGKPVLWKTGHSLIKAKMKELGAPLAGEMSGHIFFKHRWYGFDDALHAAVRLIEAIGVLGKSLADLRSAMPVVVNTPELRFPCSEARKFQVVEEVRARLEAEGARVDSTDGVRVSTPDGWWLLRASNTQDVLVARAEAKDEAALARLVAAIDAELAASGVARTTVSH
jgi:phosphomannomutase